METITDSGAPKQDENTRSNPNGSITTIGEFTEVTVLDKTPEQEPGRPLPTERTIFIEVLTKEDGTRVSGDFTFKRLNLGEIANVGVDRARRNGGMAVDDETDFLNMMIAHTSRAVVKGPEWFKPTDLYNVHVLAAVYQEVMKFEARFRPALLKQR